MLGAYLMQRGWSRLATAMAVISISAGCGLVFQGTRQNIALTSEPPGARVTFRGQEATTPNTISVKRRFIGTAVLRADLQEHYAACQVVDCGTPTWIKVLDSLPAAIPLLIDVAAGTLGDCDVHHAVLRHLPPSGVPFVIPPDETLITALEDHGFDMCRYPYLFDPEFARRASRIIVTAGGLQRPYTELGPVDFGREGADVTEWAGVWTASLGIAQGVRTFYKAPPEEINEILRRHALWLYGERVSAVINVAYETNPRNDVYGTGLAVEFTAVDSTPASTRTAGTTEGKLEDLARARERGLISEEEYRALRAKLLREF